MNRKVEGLAARAVTSQNEAPTPAGVNAATTRADSLRGSLKHSKLDEDDYRRYLEEKYL